MVLGQKRMQVVSDMLLGWTTVDGRPFQVRQFRNRKGSVDPAALAADQLDDYGRMTGALLARAHAHSADPRPVAGYCGKNEELDEAVAAFAVAYADRTEADHAELVGGGAGRGGWRPSWGCEGRRGPPARPDRGVAPVVRSGPVRRPRHGCRPGDVPRSPATPSGASAPRASRGRTPRRPRPPRADAGRESRAARERARLDG